MSNYLIAKKPSEYHARCVTCCFCMVLLCDSHPRSIYHSNNADTENEKDRCCDNCNDTVVVPNRMSSLGL